MDDRFTISQIEQASEKLGDLILQTPTWQWRGETKDGLIGRETDVFVKLELLQFAGSFKPRGALSVMLGMTTEERQNGVTAISAGNHAIAVGYAARVIGTNAKVVMPENAPRSRIDKCQEMGTEVVLVKDVSVGFQKVHEIEQQEGRKFIHPFEGRLTALGTATLGLELYRQAEKLDMVIIPIGGGGLAAGMSEAIKLCNPNCEIYGVEPEGAKSMWLSFQSGQPEKIQQVETIAKSLGAPFALPYSFRICRRNIQQIVLVTDDDLCRCMALMFHEMKLVTEPAAAAALAALLGPLRQPAQGKRVGIIACGSNIDRETFNEYVKRGESLL